jgi:hypothetical protein
MLNSRDVLLLLLLLLLLPPLLLLPLPGFLQAPGRPLQQCGPWWAGG